MTTDSSTGDWTPERGAALLRDVEEREQISPDDGPARWAPGDAPRRCVIVESTDVRAALREIERLTLARDIAETAEHRLTEERDEARGMLKNAYNDRDAMAAEIERLTAELAARAPADASLEARAAMAYAVMCEANEEPPHFYRLTAGAKALWLAVVRAVDASRPTSPPTPVIAIWPHAIAALTRARDAAGPHDSARFLLAQLVVAFTGAGKMLSIGHVDGAIDLLADVEADPIAETSRAPCPTCERPHDPQDRCQA